MPSPNRQDFPTRGITVGGNRINYIRNSVKVVIDAYNGSVAFLCF